MLGSILRDDSSPLHSEAKSVLQAFDGFVSGEFQKRRLLIVLLTEGIMENLRSLQSGVEYKDGKVGCEETCFLDLPTTLLDLDDDEHINTGVQMLPADNKVKHQKPQSDIVDDSKVFLSAVNVDEELDVQNDLASFFIGRSCVQSVQNKWFLRFTVIWSIFTFSLNLFLQLRFKDCSSSSSLNDSCPVYIQIALNSALIVAFVYIIFFYCSLQRNLLFRIVKTPTTIWIFLVTLVYTFSAIHFRWRNLGAQAVIYSPLYLVTFSIFPLVSVSDALPGKLRKNFLRWIGIVVIGVSINAFVQKVKTDETIEDLEKGLIVSFGSEKITDTSIATRILPILIVLLAEGVVNAWVRPDELAFSYTGVKVVIGNHNAGKEMESASSKEDAGVVLKKRSPTFLSFTGV